MSNVLFLGTEEDREYIPALKGMFGNTNPHVALKPVDMLSHLEMVCTKLAVTKVVSTQVGLLRALLNKIGNVRLAPKLSEYAGSLFKHSGIEIVFIEPVKQVHTVSYGRFVTQRFISKVIYPDKWPEATQFKWCTLAEKDITAFMAKAAQAYAIAIDIETFRTPPSIRCIGYTLINVSALGKITTESAVLPMTGEWALHAMRAINATKPYKIFQNGKYDNMYLLRYNSPVTNWLWDTANNMHCWYSELPKDLAFLNAFFLREVVYWKDLAETSDLFEYYRYNAMDTWATANVWIQQMLQQPNWAAHNYSLEFPLTFPCVLSELTGILRDSAKLEEQRTIITTQESTAFTSLTNMLGQPKFNPGSPKQVKQLLKVLGVKDPESSDEKTLKAVAYMHPLNNRILGKILDIRGLRKLKSTYLRTDADGKGDEANEGGSKDFKGTVLYSLNPHGTDTGRLASRESALWCGFNIQNIPRGKSVKCTLKAPPGFFIAECDLEQAESRDVAYISGDKALINAVTGTRDFHSLNASAFFGIPYEDLYDDSTKKSKNKPVRDTAKRTNHGANYNMGPDVLVDTMGLEAIWETKRILKLPFSVPRDIAEYLLCRFHATYSTLRGLTFVRSADVRKYLGIDQSAYKLYAPNTYYASIAIEVQTTNRLTSRVIHHTPRTAHLDKTEAIKKGDWTRYCFGKPWENKQALNALTAHPSQSLNARTLNEAYLRVFYEIALPQADVFRLHAQVHDSILFSYKAGYEQLTERVRECMEIPVTVRNVHGITETFTVPAAIKAGIGEKKATYWSETE